LAQSARASLVAQARSTQLHYLRAPNLTGLNYELY